MLEQETPRRDMNANLVLAFLSKHPRPMYIELALITTIPCSIANLSYITKAVSLPSFYFVIYTDQTQIYLFLKY
ncbi:Bgt-20917 [Blumeria graminis f. sp. tritici]|uniref:Bgt-20917 n=2 Tax=Blumeria graminis f. sp. tritici TaxID=62690 RepID=A0A381L2X1_BLUGR|nr:Bgt-20917 [Blumeria graminis f. sp. tritici]